MNIILRAAWQTVNIGDIAHSPAIIKILKNHLPPCNITLWASYMTQEVSDMLLSQFPDLKIIVGKISDGDSAFLEEIDRCDFFLHGSAAHFSAYNDTKEFVARTKKPFGIFGITCDTGYKFDKNIQTEKELLNQAQFIFYRDSKSLECAKANGVCAPVMRFGCDGTFAYDLANESRGLATMQKYGLKEGKFVCCIPRNRYIPYWEVKANHPYNEMQDRYNRTMEDKDHFPLIEAITQIATHTDLKVFLCPEDETQIKLGKRVIYDKLPSNIRERVVLKQEFWLPDEAVAIYKKSIGIFGCEMHSPIMCIGNGIPAIVARWREQTTKGYMFSDLGLGDWLFDFDSEEDKQRFPLAVLKMVQSPNESRKKTTQGRQNAFATYEDICGEIRKQFV